MKAGLVAICGLAGALVYLNTLPAGFTFDDNFAVVRLSLGMTCCAPAASCVPRPARICMRGVPGALRRASPQQPACCCTRQAGAAGHAGTPPAAKRHRSTTEM